MQLSTDKFLITLNRRGYCKSILLGRVKDNVTRQALNVLGHTSTTQPTLLHRQRSS